MQTLISIKIKAAILALAILVSSALGIHSAPAQPASQELSPDISRAIDAKISAALEKSKAPTLGAAPSPAALATYTLSGSGVSSSATSITLQSLTVKQTGHLIVTADLIQGVSDSFYVTIEPGNTSRQEIVGCTTVTQNSNGTATLSGCVRGLSPYYPYTTSSSYKFTHAGASQVIFGDAPQIFNDFNNYVATALSSGAVDSSATVKGIVEKALLSEAAGHAAIGSGNTTAPLALTTDIASSTRSANVSNVIVASTTGYIDDSFVSLTNPSFAATTTVATLKITSPSQVYDSSGNQILWELIASTTNVGTTASVDLQNIPTRTFLKVVISIAGYSSADYPAIRFNNDSGSTYAISTATTTSTGTFFNTSVPLNASTNPYFLSMDVMNLLGLYKPVTISLVQSANSFRSVATQNYGGTWFSSSNTQINRITVLGASSNNLTATTTILVYGSAF